MAGTQAARVLLGEAAEHLVLARLLRRGYVASQAPRAWKADDILVQGGPRIQVKANLSGPKAGWMVGDVSVDAERFYALVDFSNEGSPVVYVLASAAVRLAAESYDAAWHLLKPHAADSAIRKIEDPLRAGVKLADYPGGWLQQHRERWDLITPG